MKNQGKDYGDMFNEANQKAFDANEAERDADVEEQKASGKSPNKFWAKLAGAVIGANKKRQAAKDAGDAQEAAGKQQAYSRKL